MISGPETSKSRPIHAVLIGVSDYVHLHDDPAEGPVEHLGLTKLSSPALSAYRVYEWLQRRRNFLPGPLASCRVFASASAEELQAAPGLARWTDRPTLDNVRRALAAWRKDLAADRDSIALFYFAGHGVKRESDDILLLDGFGENPSLLLDQALDNKSLMKGMRPSSEFPEISRTQLYFFDACRINPDLFRKYEKLKTGQIWDDTELTKEDDRSMLVLYTTVDGAEAYGIPGQQSFFSHALISCLDGAGAEAIDAGMEKWHVTGSSLAAFVQTQLDAINRLVKKKQTIEIGRSPSLDFVLNELETPPNIDIHLNIDPEDVRPWAKVSVFDRRDRPAWNLPFPVTPLPHDGKLAAGIYSVTASDTREMPEWRPEKWFLQVTPRKTHWRLNILPYRDQ